MNGVYGRLFLAHDAYDMSEYYCIIIDNGNIFAKIEEKTLLNHDMIQRPNYKNNLCLFCKKTQKLKYLGHLLINHPNDRKGIFFKSANNIKMKSQDRKTSFLVNFSENKKLCLFGSCDFNHNFFFDNFLKIVQDKQTS